MGQSCIKKDKKRLEVKHFHSCIYIIHSYELEQSVYSFSMVFVKFVLYLHIKNEINNVHALYEYINIGPLNYPTSCTVKEHNYISSGRHSTKGCKLLGLITT